MFDSNCVIVVFEVFLLHLIGLCSFGLCHERIMSILPISISRDESISALKSLMMA